MILCLFSHDGNCKFIFNVQSLSSFSAACFTQIYRMINSIIPKHPPIGRLDDDAADDDEEMVESTKTIICQMCS